MATRARNESGGRLDRLREGGRAAARRSGSFIGGLLLIIAVLAILVALVSYQPADPSPNTAAAVFAPSIPCATAMLVATSATTPATANVSLRMRLDLPSEDWVPRKPEHAGCGGCEADVRAT